MFLKKVDKNYNFTGYPKSLYPKKGISLVVVLEDFNVLKVLYCFYRLNPLRYKPGSTAGQMQHFCY